MEVAVSLCGRWTFVFDYEFGTRKIAVEVMSTTSSPYREALMLGPFAFVFFLLIFAPQVRARPQKPAAPLPTDDEIKLVLTQAERAVTQYEPLLKMEEQTLGKKGIEAVAKDREVVSAIKLAIEGFKKQPQAFNGPLGFTFFEWLDDADRNALLCAGTALNDANSAIANGEKGQAAMNLTLAQGCQAVSTLFYTVSENAGALYARYVQVQADAVRQAAEIARKCTALLKQQSAPRN